MAFGTQSQVLVSNDTGWIYWITDPGGGTGNDAVVSIDLTVVEAGVGTSSVALGLSDVEAGSGADAVALGVSSTDVGSGASTVALGLSAVEAGSSTDVAALGLSDVDAGASADLGAQVGLSSSQAGAGVDAGSAAPSSGQADIGSGADSGVISAALTDYDSGRAYDVGQLGAFEAVADSDSGVASDLVVSVVPSTTTWGNRWRLDDPKTAESYTFEISPVESGSPTYDVQMAYALDTPGGLLAMRQQVKPRIFEFTGELVSQDQYATLYAWYRKGRSLQVTDALGRSFTVYLTAWTPVRKASVTYPWRHSYTARGYILAGAS